MSDLLPEEIKAQNSEAAFEEKKQVLKKASRGRRGRKKKAEGQQADDFEKYYEVRAGKLIKVLKKKNGNAYRIYVGNAKANKVKIDELKAKGLLK